MIAIGTVSAPGGVLANERDDLAGMAFEARNDGPDLWCVG